MTNKEKIALQSYLTGSLKCTLEYNAAVVYSATAWVGNVNSKADLKKYKQDMAKIGKDYHVSLARLEKIVMEELQGDKQS